MIEWLKEDWPEMLFGLGLASIIIAGSFFLGYLVQEFLYWLIGYRGQR